MKAELKLFFKQYGLIVSITLTILIVLVIRSTATWSFKPDAFRHALPTISGSEMITTEKATALPGNKLIIIFGNSENYNIPSASVISLSPDSILEKEYFGLIKNNNGPVLLSSTDQSVSARIWMILAQKGIDDLYILSSDDDEVSKNKFRVDTGSSRD